MSRGVGLLCVMFMLCGCVTKDLSHENRQRVKTVWFKPAEFPLKSFQFNSMTQALEAGVSAGSKAASGTTLAPAVLASTSLANSRKADETAMTPRQAIVLNMQQNGIDVGAMLRDRFKARVASEHVFLVVDDEAKADAKIELIVSQWGVSLINFSKELYPTMGVVAVMRRGGDEQIWRNFETITALSEGNDKAFTPERYAADPDAIRSAFGRAVDLLTDKLMTDLKQ
ncbi:hypothetical protein GIV19_00260 [Pseudomonas syringae]|nr:hypothetical protein [Pseudomonas syringae]